MIPQNFKSFYPYRSTLLAGGETNCSTYYYSTFQTPIAIFKALLLTYYAGIKTLSHFSSRMKEME